jgi:urocanate hydratase
VGTAYQLPGAGSRVIMTEHSALINFDNVFDPAPVYERFVALTELARSSLHSDLAGKLIFCGTVDERASKTVLAASIAGAATLGVSADPEQIKQIIRNNVCDFIVNSLDEALRILKNEIRKKLPVSVCLQQDFATTIQEFAARGVQPDVLALSAEEANTQPDKTSQLVDRGATLLPAAQGRSADGVYWSVPEYPVLWLPKIDRLATEVLGDEMRKRWLHLAPRYLGRRSQSIRYVDMTEQESDSFAAAIRTAQRDGRIETEVVIRRGESEERITLVV